MTAARPCKVCGEPIVRHAALAPRTCLPCYLRAHRTAREERKPLPAYSLTRAALTGPRQVTRAQPKAEPHRARCLLDLAHLVHFCTNCEEYVPHGCEPAHANGAVWGKGLGQKADDWAHAALCHTCHRWLDQGGAAWDPTGRYAFTAEDRREMWTAAHFKTAGIYFRAGWLGVVMKPPKEAVYG